MKKLFLLVCFSACFGFTGLFAQTIYTVGPGKTYTSFDAAITALNATNPLPAGGIIYNVDPSWTSTENPRAIVLSAANNTAAFPIIFQVNGGVVTTANHAIIRPTNGTTTPNSPVNNNAGIEIVGGDYITFNGVDITINSGSTLRYGYYLRNASVNNGAQRNTIKNCTVKLSGSTNLNGIGVYQNIGGGNPASVGGANSYNTYDAVSVTTCYKGFVLNGLASATLGDINCEIKNCITGSGGAIGDIGSATTVSNPKTVGIEAANQIGVSVHDCEVKNVGYNSSSAGYGYGIFFNSVYGTSSLYKNSVHDIVGLNPSTGDKIHGIDILSGNSSAVVNVYNNFVHSIFSSGSASAAPGPTGQLIGLYIQGTASSTVNIYFNSIFMGTPSSITYSSLNLNYGTGALYSNTVTLNLRNNIIKSNIVTGNRKHYLVYFAGGTLLTSDYNNYDCAANGSGSVGYFTGFMGSDIAAIGAWRTATGSDVNSKQFTTDFLSTVAGSVDLHILIPGCTFNAQYQGVFINGVYPAITGLDSVDIDADPRVYPCIGADEINSTVDVTISPNQPFVGTAAKLETNHFMYGVIVTANNGDAVFSSITLTAGSDNPPGYFQNSNRDFKNFRLYIDSINGNFDAVTSKLLGTAVTNAPAIGGTITFSAANLYTLTACKVYYLFVVADIGTVTAPAALSGDNMNLNNAIANFSFSGPVKASSSTGASGYQYIVDKYFNFPQKDVNYSSTWYVPIPPYLSASDTIIYTGDFTNNFHVFQMITNPVDSMETPWAISGTLSKLIVGHHLGASAVTFPVQQTYTGTADVWNLGTIRFKTATIPTTLGILATGSTVFYDSAFSQTVKSAKYYNLTLGGTRSDPGATITLNPYAAIADSINIAGTFIANATFPGGGSYVPTGSIVTFNGTAVQTIPSFDFNVLTIRNTSGVALNATTGTGAVVVNSGNTISVGSAASSFKVTTGNLCMNGTWNNSSTTTTVFANTNANLGFSATGIFNHTATDAGQIPPATWNAASNIYVTGLTNSSNGVTASAPAAPGFGNITYDNPGGLNVPAPHRLFGNYGTTVNIQGNLTLGRTNSAAAVQMTAGTTTINIGGHLNVYAGNYGLITYANTTTTNVTGNVVIDATYPYAVSGYTAPILTLASNGVCNFSIKGNLSLISGTNTASLVHSASVATITFNGTLPQTISSNLPGNIITGASPVGTTAAINNAAGVTLTSGRFNPAVLSFTGNGLFTVGTGAILNPGSVTGYNSARYIITNGTGVLKQLTTKSVNWVFPLGTSTTSYNPLTLNYSDGAAADSFAVNLSPTYTYPPAMPSFVVNTQYDITKHLGGSVLNATLTMQWNAANEAVGFQRTNSPLVIGHYTGGAWVETGTGGAALGAGPYTTSATGFTTFSPFGPGNCSAFGANLGCTLLPVDLLSFSGKANGSISQLAWKTTREVNVKEFTVERGLDGSHFDGIGNVAAKNISGQSEYGFDDRSVPAAGIVYYRLKIMSKDGQYKYSQVIALNFKKGTGAVQVFPNPVRNNLFMTHEKAVSGASVSIYTAAGSKTGEYPVSAGATQTSINTASLSAGMYSLKYQNNGLIEIVRFAKL